ncbi:hypothetical protein IAI18_05855 [Acetobacteraceae bacterium H6797]|nr:hypothetical protein [Acetobacteraceae bacterium H6797]
MADSNTDPVALAATRLETAVERLAEVLARRLAQAPAAGTSPEAVADMVPRAEVIALAEKLDDTIARLRAAIGDAADDEGAEMDAILTGEASHEKAGVGDVAEEGEPAEEAAPDHAEPEAEPHHTEPHQTEKER